VHLEARLTPVAFDRATGDDVLAMRAALDRMDRADTARAFLDAVMTLHRALVAAARVPVLDAMHQAVVALLRSTLSRATFVEGYEPLLRHSIDVHRGIVEAISSRNRTAFSKVMLLHHDDLVRADDPRRSPAPLPPRSRRAKRSRWQVLDFQIPNGGHRKRVGSTLATVKNPRS
jgi:DNA-binding FadR family transcriptional regulator